MNKKVRPLFSFRALFCYTFINQISYSNKIVVLLIQTSHCCSRAAQWLECQCAYISVVEVTLSNTLHPDGSWGVTPADHDPLSLWIRKEFLITLYVWSALNSCVKLCTLKHITPQIQPPSVLYTKLEASCSGLWVTHLLYTFSFLAFCGFPNLTHRVYCEAWVCRKSTRAFTLFSVLWMLRALNKNI